MAESYDQDKELNRFRGLEVNGGGMDEINECRIETFHKVIERSGTWLHAVGNAPTVVLATCNPTSNWVKTTFFDPWREGTLNPRWAYIPAKITDNPHIPQAYIDNLRSNLPPLEYERFVNGDWEAIDTEGRFATYWDDTRHIQPCTFTPSVPLHISFDFNLEPFAFVFYQAWTDNNGPHLHFFDEAEIHGGDIFKAADEIRTRYRMSLWSAIITGDYNGNASNIGAKGGASHYAQLIRELNIQPRQVQTSPNPRHSNSRNDLNYVLYHHPDIRFSPKLTGVIRDMRLVKADETGSLIKAKRSDVAQRADFMDAVRYAINHKSVQDWIALDQRMKSMVPVSQPRELLPVVEKAIKRVF